MLYEKLHTEWIERADKDVPEPPHLLPAMTNDAHRQDRWKETVEWAEQYGFEIAPISEDEKYYKM